MVYKKPIVLERKGECIECTSHTKKDGYTVITKNWKFLLLHRVVYTLYFGEVDSDTVIRHTCDNPACVNPKHLVAGTHQDNVIDRVSRNRSARGVKNGRSKLTMADVEKIRKDTTTSVAELARRYGVDPKSIRDVKSYRTWK